MSLLSDDGRLSVLLAKCVSEPGGFEGDDLPRRLKRPKVDAVRQFPQHCGALAPRFIGTCNVAAVGNLMVGSESKVVAVKPSVELVLSDLNFEPIKPLISHVSLDATGPVPLNAVEMGIPVALGKVELDKAGANGSQSKQFDALGSLEMSSLPRLLPKKYPLPKIRKGINIFRQFPAGLKRLNHDSSSKPESLPNAKSDVEQRPLLEIIQRDNKRFRDECHDDGISFSRKLDGNTCKDFDNEFKAKSGKVTQNEIEEVFEETPSECELKHNEDTEDICIIPTSHSINSHSDWKCNNACNSIDGPKSQVGRIENGSENCISYKLADNKMGWMIPSGKLEPFDFDLVSSFGDVVTGMPQGKMISNCALTEATFELKGQKYEVMGTDTSRYLILKPEETNSLEQNSVEEEPLILGVELGKAHADLASDDNGERNYTFSAQKTVEEEPLILGVELGKAYAGLASDDMGERDYTLAAKKNNNFRIVPFDIYQAAVCRNKVGETLNFFREILEKRLVDSKKQGKVSSYIYVETAMLLKQQDKWINMNKLVLGAVPGVEVGEKFYSRAELVIIGLHHQFSSGIDYMKNDGKNLATSIVVSDRYENVESSDVLIYSGQGGNPSIADKEPKDQILVRGNLALKNSIDAGTPVRVVRGCRNWKKCNSSSANREKKATFIYDGLYVVSNYWEDIGKYGKIVLKFELHRIPGQPILGLDYRICSEPKLSLDILSRSRKSKVPCDCIVVNDISHGKEKIPIHVVNAIDHENPPSFNYITNIIYPQMDESCMRSSCDCIDGCLDYVKCSCVIMNGGEVPFNDNGAILRRKTVIYECGPSCSCPPSCKNRVSQHGVRFQLEVFKTQSRGWGVRSRDFISSGSFICEYVGELLREDQAEERTDYDEYLFDIGIRQDVSNACHNLQGTVLENDNGFAIDAAHFGNVGRFINHSCSPNLYAQDILFDHNDKRMPHVMLFATKNIPPLQELTYDYNYKIDQVRDANGDIKTKACYCGARGCTGRMY